MKKYIILCGSLLLIVVMLLTPSIPAMEYKTIKDKIQSDSYTKLEGIQKNIEELKTLGKNLNINLKLILSILIRGILLPVLLLTIEYIFVGKIYEVYPVLAMIIVVIMDLLAGGYIIYSLLDILYIETGSVLLTLIIYYLLGFISIRLFAYVVKILGIQAGNNSLSAE